MDEAKNQINSLEYNEAKNTQREQQKEKRIDLPNEGNVRSLWDKSSIPIFTYHGGAGRRREQEIENLFEKIVTELSEGNRHTSPKQDEPKEVHTKTHPNEDAKG